MVVDPERVMAAVFELQAERGPWPTLEAVAHRLQVPAVEVRVALSELRYQRRVRSTKKGNGTYVLKPMRISPTQRQG